MGSGRNIPNAFWWRTPCRLASSHGYNTFFRTRNLDGIPFSSLLRFDIELLSWVRGTVDYATTVYWYGDMGAKVVDTSGLEEAQPKTCYPFPAIYLNIEEKIA